MNITLNGVSHDLPDGLSLETLLEVNGYGDKRIAVEINRQIIPRSQYGAREIHQDDRIEIVHAIGGG